MTALSRTPDAVATPARTDRAEIFHVDDTVSVVKLTRVDGRVRQWLAARADVDAADGDLNAIAAAPRYDALRPDVSVDGLARCDIDLVGQLLVDDLVAALDRGELSHRRAVRVRSWDFAVETPARPGWPVCVPQAVHVSARLYHLDEVETVLRTHPWVAEVERDEGRPGVDHVPPSLKVIVNVDERVWDAATEVANQQPRDPGEDDVDAPEIAAVDWQWALVDAPWLRAIHADAPDDAPDEPGVDEAEFSASDPLIAVVGADPLGITAHARPMGDYRGHDRFSGRF